MEKLEQYRYQPATTQTTTTEPANLHSDSAHKAEPESGSAAYLGSAADTDRGYNSGETGTAAAQEALTEQEAAEAGGNAARSSLSSHL